MFAMDHHGSSCYSSAQHFQNQPVTSAKHALESLLDILRDQSAEFLDSRRSHLLPAEESSSEIAAKMRHRGQWIEVKVDIRQAPARDLASLVVCYSVPPEQSSCEIVERIQASGKGMGVVIKLPRVYHPLTTNMSPPPSRVGERYDENMECDFDHKERLAYLHARKEELNKELSGLLDKKRKREAEDEKGVRSTKRMR